MMVITTSNSTSVKADLRARFMTRPFRLRMSVDDRCASARLRGEMLYFFRSKSMVFFCGWTSAVNSVWLL